MIENTIYFSLGVLSAVIALKLFRLYQHHQEVRNRPMAYRLPSLLQRQAD